LARGTYTQTEQKKLLAVYDGLPADYRLVDAKQINSFVKEEMYEEYKHARMINARCDEAKVLMGPVFQKISDSVMHHKRNGYTPFIKFVPIAERPNYIQTHLKPHGRRVAESDYTTYEALFVKELMWIEVQMYNYMIKDWDSELRRMYGAWFKVVLTGQNVQWLKELVITVEALRQSGEMCTSLGNGFANLMFHLFIFEECFSIPIDIVVEGDDALITFLLALTRPTPTTEFYSEVGLIVKLVYYDDISHAGFCGLIFDPFDLVNITEPLQVACNFAWTFARYTGARLPRLKALLRCKALSYLHQYPGAPVIQSVALYGLRMTEGADVNLILNSGLLCQWERQQVMAALNSDLPTRPVPANTRHLMADKFALSVPDQIKIEAIYDNKTDLTAVDLDFIEFPDAWMHYGEHYCLGITGPINVWANYFSNGRPDRFTHLLNNG